MAYRRLDQILSDKGQVSEQQVAQALYQQALRGGRLGEHLLRNGDVNEAELVEALSEQTGVPGVTISNRTIDSTLFEHLSLDVAEQYLCIPIALEDNDSRLAVAFADPLDAGSVETVADAIAPLAITPLIGLATHIHAALTEARADLSSTVSAEKQTDSDHDAPEVTACLDLLELAAARLSSACARDAGGLDASRLVREVARRVGLSQSEIRRIRIASAAVAIANGHLSSSSHGPFPAAAALLRGIGMPEAAQTLDQSGDDLPAGESLPIMSQILVTCRDLAAAIGDQPLAEFDAETWKEQFVSRHSTTVRTNIIEKSIDAVQARYVREQLFTPAAELLLIGDGHLAASVQHTARGRGLRVVRNANLEDAINSANRRRPDLVCLLNPIGVDRAGRRLARLGVKMSSVLLVMPHHHTAEIDMGVTHVLRVDPDLPEPKSIVQHLLGMLSEMRDDHAPAEAHQSAAHTDPIISGRLEDLGIADLIQVLSSAHKTVRVDLTNGNQTASLWFHSGRIIRAESDVGVAEIAFYQLMQWAGGRFEVRPIQELPGTNILTPTTALLLEALRRIDESSKAPV